MQPSAQRIKLRATSRGHIIFIRRSIFPRGCNGIDIALNLSQECSRLLESVDEWKNAPGMKLTAWANHRVPPSWNHPK